MKIKNILFDFGGVIVTLSPDEATKRFKALGMVDAEKSLDSYTQQGIFGDLERGKITDEEFRTAFSQQVGHDVTWEECKHAWLGYAKDVPQRNLKALLKLREDGFRVIMLSNTNPFMMSWAMSDDFDGNGHPVSYYMDAVYTSYKCGVMKPDEMFFRKVLMKEQIMPEETLFLDDGPRNVAAASQLGINTFLVGNGDDWTEEIYNYLEGVKE